ncbi:gluconeogenesis factor YvcK family protein [Halopolyspora algeriensis]|uniref:gluconeogenesis factor YvcK family protein n=1 Tax=Halopolyspora algeriensis TaxID=1500506 RepID=UPI000DF10DE3|nr:uridine diphosphate-N-acetylglucosamine-binding protein YvcK [Halopolyspora algeriensis]
MRAVALGGGHGLQASLAALRQLTSDVTAVVTVADDGGSSGRLRRELGMLPPGDLRKALAALSSADTSGQMWSQVFEHRFGGNGALAGHAVGNLVLAGLLEVLEDPVEVLDQACCLLGVRGRVLPMSAAPVDMEADVTGLDTDPRAIRTIRGQVAIASTPGRVKEIRLFTTDGQRKQPIATPEAVRAVFDADVVVLGPGSWFTSVLPHVMVPELREALVTTRAHRLVVLNLVPQPGETAGFSPEQHLHVLSQHAPRLRVDAVLADTASVPTPDRLRAAAAELGAQTLLDQVATSASPGRHEPGALAACLAAALERRTDWWR